MCGRPSPTHIDINDQLKVQHLSHLYVVVVTSTTSNISRPKTSSSQTTLKRVPGSCCYLRPTTPTTTARHRPSEGHAPKNTSGYSPRPCTCFVLPTTLQNTLDSTRRGTPYRARNCHLFEYLHACSPQLLSRLRSQGYPSPSRVPALYLYRAWVSALPQLAR